MAVVVTSHDSLAMKGMVGENMMGADPKLYTTPSWTWLALVVPGALLFAALASVLPARRAVGLQVTEALRYE